MMGCIISPVLFVLIMKMVLRSAEVNTNEITGPSMQALMEDVTLVAESKSLMKQLATNLQDIFKWAVMKIKPSKCCSLSIIKGNRREINLSVDRNEIPTVREQKR